MAQILSIGNRALEISNRVLTAPAEEGRFVEIGGRKYPYVQIGTQLWMAENLDWKVSGIGIGGSQTGNANAWYYNNDEATYGINGNKFGLLYNFAAANIIANALSSEWHIPTESEANALIDKVRGDANVLKSTLYWNNVGTNELDFSAVPSGYRGSSFEAYGKTCILRTSTIYSGDAIKSIYLMDSGIVEVAGPNSSNVGLAIRLVRTLT